MASCTCSHAPEQHVPANIGPWEGCTVIGVVTGPCRCEASQLDMARDEIARRKALTDDIVLARVTDHEERLATAVVELYALVRLAVALAGDDENWATWVAQARAKLKELGL